ncbi:LysR family transcriptional regulator [Agrococcus carbonis]|uniref:DNA-binding transcriptional regulator, LysR family n=1 Tax=Agrococcus carbonis TaxID=684552 RepID=A0A1H1Q1V9_9MICO|nr:LysR family transcriptional regulator [Agrococcus carbonis]SDS17396.1 DNA-binding transcriptional regulator, LysR family [Agrococcus carbonis]
MDAENLRYLLEVARTGRLRDAAAQLQVDETTVSRRISRLEQELGVRMFDRTPQGWRITEPGRLVIPHAEAIESSVSRALEAVVSRAGDLSGTARILAPDGFGANVLVPGMRPLLDAHPGLSLEVITATSHDLITARDFDVAVTLERPSPRAAAVQHLADYELRCYASRDYLERHGTPASVDELRRDHALIWYVDALLDVQPLRILDELLPRANARLQTNNITGQHSATRAGLGVGLLPTYIGDADPSLVGVLPEEVRVSRTYWLVVPRDLAELLRVREITQALHALVAEHPLLTPRAR